MNDILQGVINFAQFLLNNLNHPLAGWVVGIIALLYVWWNNRKEYAECNAKLVVMTDKHESQIKTLHRIIAALSRSYQVARQRLIKAGMMEPEDDTEAQKTLSELLYEKDDDIVN